MSVVQSLFSGPELERSLLPLASISFSGMKRASEPPLVGCFTLHGSNVRNFAILRSMLHVRHDSFSADLVLWVVEVVSCMKRAVSTVQYTQRDLLWCVAELQSHGTLQKMRRHLQSFFEIFGRT